MMCETRTRIHVWSFRKPKGRIPGTIGVIICASSHPNYFN